MAGAVRLDTSNNTDNLKKATGHQHPKMNAVQMNYRNLLEAMELSPDEIAARMSRLDEE